MSPISAIRLAAIAGPTPGMVCSRRESSESSSSATRFSAASICQSAQEVILLDQEPDLERHLLIKLGWGDGVPSQLLDAVGPPDSNRPTAAGLDGLGQRAQPAPGGASSGRRLPEDGQCSVAGGVLEGLLQFWKPDLDQPQKALADIGLIADQAHAEACRLAYLGAQQRLPRRGLVAHTQGCQCARVGRV